MLAHLIASLLEAPLVVADPFEVRDAIVVLGAPLARDGGTTRVLDERIAAAAWLWHARAGRIVIASGGATGASPRTEADVIADRLRAAGVAAAAIVVEPCARSTADNARLTAAVAAPLGLRSVWLVTQPFHGRRAAWLFRRAGLDARVWHIADSLEYRERGRALRWLVREYAAWARLAI